MMSLNRDSGQTLKNENTDPKVKFIDEIKIEQKLDEEKKKKIIKLLEKYEDVCMYGNKKLKTTNVVKHGIELREEAKLTAQRAYRESEQNRKVIKNEITKMLKDGIIRESKSSYPSLVVIVGKKDGSKRFCIDYRKLNRMTKIDAYPLPRMDDLLEKFRIARYLTTVDLTSDYWQVEMEEEAKELTAFICSQGLYEFNKMPFELTNAPATFQRMMNKLLEKYIDDFVNVYINDIIIYLETFEEHLQHLEMVLKKLKEANMIIKMKKCE